MKQVFITLLVLVVNIVDGQMTTSATMNEYTLQTLTAEIKHQKYSEGITNKNEYFNYDFQSATIDGFKEKEKLRYNALLDDFEFLRDGYLYKMNKMSNQIIRFDDGRTFKYISFIDGNNLMSRYLQVLTDINQKLVLYRKLAIDEVDGLGSSGLNASNKKNYFKQDKLLIIYNDRLYNVPNSVKKYNELTDKNVKEIVSFNKLNLKKEQDLIKLIDLLNK
ncbi:hypothetical protein [Empedobacter brevis]|uniref:hypothetical protein n=1 Tax=Empedobacter brevis TaxID=247 RepID=UPI0028AC7582|nr:hypothetical protein [Empedobacter brevis]